MSGFTRSIRAASRRRSLLATVVALLLGVAAAPAAAGIIGGGGARSQDCRAVYSTAADTGGRAHVRCVDGDASCDGDATVNGECVFPVGVCANSTYEPRCTSNGVDSIEVAHAADNGDPLFDPSFQALQARIDDIDFPTFDADECTNATNIVVKLKGPFPGNVCRSARKVVRLTTRSTPILGVRKTDRDSLRLTCMPAPTSCEPQVLFSGTFDRVQQQIFNQNCALSGCHDSQSQTGGLLLEVGSSYGELVNVVPNNAEAQNRGWNRITVLSPTVGDPEASFIYHKVTGDLGPGLGSRMPLNRKPLPGFLIEILRLWIEAGAPDVGWVPGTDS